MHSQGVAVVETNLVLGDYLWVARPRPGTPGMVAAKAATERLRLAAAAAAAERPRGRQRMLTEWADQSQSQSQSHGAGAGKAKGKKKESHIGEDWVVLDCVIERKCTDDLKAVRLPREITQAQAVVLWLRPPLTSLSLSRNACFLYSIFLRSRCQEHHGRPVHRAEGAARALRPAQPLLPCGGAPSLSSLSPHTLSHIHALPTSWRCEYQALSSVSLPLSHTLSPSALSHLF